MNVTKAEFYRTSPCTAAWEDVLCYGEKRTLAKGFFLFREGDVVSSLYYLAQGKVRMETLHPNGEEKIVWYIGEKSLLGETPLMHRLPSVLSCLCVQPCTMYAFSETVLWDKVLNTRTHRVKDILYGLTMKIRVLTNQINTLTLDDLQVRVCKFLHLHMQRDQEGRAFIASHINQQEMASILGVHRVTCNRALKNLVREGVISGLSNKKMYILDETAFQHYLRAGKAQRPFLP